MKMAYLENEKQEIQNTWFHEHVATIEGGEGLQVIHFGKPGANMYRVKYVLSGNNLFISGDIGDAVYTLTCAATLANLKDFNLSYLTGKLTASSEARWCFNENNAKKELREFWKAYKMDRYDDAKAIYKGILHAINEAHSFEGYRAHLDSVYHNTSVSGDDLEQAYDFGKEMPMHLIAYWVGLQMAMEHLAAKKEKTT